MKFYLYIGIYNEVIIQLTLKIYNSEAELWSRSRWSRMFSAGVRVGFQNCWSRSRFFKTAGVGVGSQSRNICCNYRLQCLLNNLNYNINCLKIITG